jgi:preprotein translocase subunit SecD
LLGALPAAAATQARWTTDSPRPGAATLAFHLLAPIGSPDALRLPLRGSGTTVPVHREVLLSLADLDAVKVLPVTAAHANLGFQLTAAATETYRDLTATHIGRQLAVVVNGELVMIPFILSENATGQGFIRNITEGEARSIASRVGKEIDAGHAHSR